MLFIHLIYVRLVITMPYSLKHPQKKLVKRIKKKYPSATKSQIRQFIHVFQNAIDEGDEESSAFAKAWGVLKKNKHKHKKAFISEEDISEEDFQEIAKHAFRIINLCNIMENS